MDLQKIGACLKELRKEKALTQEQLAERFNVSVKTVSRWENGVHMPDLSLLLELADFYEVDLRALLQGERENSRMTADTKETVQQAASYSKAQYKASLQFDPILAAVFLTIGAVLLFPTVLLARSSMGNPDNAKYLLWHLFPVVLALPLFLRSKLWTIVTLGGLIGVHGLRLILRIIVGSMQGIEIAHLLSAILLLIVAATALQRRCVRLRKKLWFLPAFPYLLFGMAAWLDVLIINSGSLWSAPDLLYWFSVYLPDCLIPCIPILYGLSFLFAGRWFAEE